MKNLALFALPLLVSACVTPDVVETSRLDDSRLTCQQISTELAQLETIRAEAKKGKTVSGENVAAALLFWPALISNNVNANEALDAANRRQEVLVGLSNRRGCA